MSDWRRHRAQRADRIPVLPLSPEPASNGEFVPAPPTPRDRAVRAEILRRVAGAAHRAGVDRRRFLQSSAGVAASLSVFNACASDDGAIEPTTTAGRSSSTPPPTTGGSFEVPPAADVVECERALTGTEFIFDVHTHHVVPDGPWRQNAQRIASMIEGLVPDGCTEADPLRCLDRTAYLHDMFLASDTTMSLLSDVPNSGPADAPVPWAEKLETRRLADALASPGADRVLIHDVIAPNFGELPMH